MRLGQSSMCLTASLGLGVLAAVSQQQRGAVQAHSWIDCIDTDYDKIYTQSASYIFGGAGSNGFCDGYGAGYPGRGDKDIGTEYTHKMLENRVEAGTDVCQSVAADTYTNMDWRTMLSVAAGETVYFSYLPNGHVVKDKKAVGTQHGVYWTGVPGTQLTSTLEMTAENLLDGHTLDFDDGNCGETTDNNGNPSGRAGDGKPCIGSFVIPAGTAAGTYSFVWYWTFWLDDRSAYVDQEQASGYFGAAYSTCFQVEVTSSGQAAATIPTPVATTAAPVATTAAPVVTTATPVATSASPVATTASPVPTMTTPAPTTSTPAPTAATPVPTATTPVPTTATTVPTTSAPTATTTAPKATQKTSYRSMIDTFSDLNSNDSSQGSVHPHDSSTSSSSEETDSEVGQATGQESILGGVIGSSDVASASSVGSPSDDKPLDANTSENAAAGRFKAQDLATAVVCVAFVAASVF